MKIKDDVNLGMDNNKSEVFNLNHTNNNINNQSLITFEGLLNEKYSIPPKLKENNLDDKENKNIYNYTQNIVYNNYIQYSSRNKPILEKDNKIISSIRKEKADFSSMDQTTGYFNKDENATLKIETNKLTENSISYNNNISSIDDKDIKNKHKHKHTHSYKNEEENKKRVNIKAKVKTKKQKKNQIDNKDRDNNEEIKGIAPK